MYKLCKTEQSAKRQRELEQQLLSAMCNHQYEEISISDLCEQAQVPRKSFYRYFSSKDGALHALLDHTLMEYESYPYTAQAGERRSYQLDLERFFCFWRDQKRLLDALQRSNLTGVLFNRSVSHALSDMGMPTRFLPQNEKVEREYAVMFGVCGLMSLVNQWHQEGYQLTPKEMSRIATGLLTQPLFSDRLF